MTKSLTEKIEAIMRKYTPGDFTHFKPAAEDIVTLFHEEENRRVEELAVNLEAGKEDYLYDENNPEHEDREEMASSVYDTLGEAEQEGRNQALGRAASLLRSTKNEGV